MLPGLPERCPPVFGQVRVFVVVIAVSLVLAGCGAESRVRALKPLTPSEAKKLVASFHPRACNLRGQVLIRYSSPVVHGKGSDGWWCVAPADAYRVIGRDLHCPVDSHVSIDLRRRRALCEP